MLLCEKSLLICGVVIITLAASNIDSGHHGGLRLFGGAGLHQVQSPPSPPFPFNAGWTVVAHPQGMAGEGGGGEGGEANILILFLHQLRLWHSLNPPHSCCLSSNAGQIIHFWCSTVLGNPCLDIRVNIKKYRSREFPSWFSGLQTQLVSVRMQVQSLTLSVG